MSQVIKILTFKLNYDTANLIFNEYQDRLREMNYLLDNYKYYKNLIGKRKAIETLLALSIFYKRLIANFEGFLDFSNTLHRNQVNQISIGNKKFDKKELTALYFIHKDFLEMMEKFNVSYSLFDYNETKEFLKNIIDYRLK